MPKIEIKHETKTLDLVDQAIEDKELSENGPSRGYCSASNIGTECLRSLWYGFRWAKDIKLKGQTLRLFEKGHRAEDLMAERLRLSPGVILITIDENTNEQLLETFFGGHFKCYVDGLITGIAEAPKTTHVWEHKETNQKKFTTLLNLLKKHDEKEVLEKWNKIYYAQAIVSMWLFKKKRHFMTVTTDGGAVWTSIRTNENNKLARELLENARKVFTSQRPPARISNDPDFYLCKFCDYSDICRSENPVENPIAFNCRTCSHSTINPNGNWDCEVHLEDGPQIIPREYQSRGCRLHIFNPGLVNINPSSRETDGNQTTVQVNYKKDGQIFCNEIGQKKFRIKGK